MLLEQREGILNDVCGKKGEVQAENAVKFISSQYVDMLKSIEPEYLSPDELHDVSMRLAELEKPPTTEYYKTYFNALLDAKAELLKSNPKHIAIGRIDDKIADHAKALYLYLKANNKQTEIQEIFAPAVYSADPEFDWKSGVMPLKANDGKINDAALTRLSEHSTAMAWKATIQLVNHQIQKLSVNERHIESENERLKSVSSWGVSKVTAQDLMNANIVSFVTSNDRKEYTKIEVDVGGKRREIDHDTFFSLLTKSANKEALTHPNVVGIINYLRNSSTTIEAEYQSKISNVQRQAFAERLTISIDKATNRLKADVIKLTEIKEKLTQMIDDDFAKHITSLEEQIEQEKASIGVGKNSVHQGIWKHVSIFL